MIWDRKGSRSRDDSANRAVPANEPLLLPVDQLKPSPHNPRKLFDPAPLKNLRESIRKHGVLVPLTVYKLPGQNRYGIIDGERRYRCCRDLAAEGRDVSVPVNVVASPDNKASLIYMFNIHQFREQWELMPMALALESLMELIGTSDSAHLRAATGLSDPTLKRCRIILSFPERYRKMSLEEDPSKRIRSNFWIELHPLLDLIEEELPDRVERDGRDGVTDLLVEKYRRGRIKSVIHFRRILEAFDVQDDEDGREHVREVIGQYLDDPDLETRKAFDEFIADSRRREGAIEAVQKFMNRLRRLKVGFITKGREELIARLSEMRSFVDELLDRLEGGDAPGDNEEAG